MEDLPKLTAKENMCLMRYFTNGFNKSEAYRYAYDCKNANDNTIWVNASRFFSSTKVALWMAEYQKNQQKAVQEELKYSAVEHFKELENLKDIALACSDKYHNPNINAALRAEELKGKLAGLYSEQRETTNNEVVVMGEIKIDDDKLSFKVGSDRQSELACEEQASATVDRRRKSFEKTPQEQRGDKDDNQPA